MIQNVVITRGDSRTLNLTFTNTNGSPIDLTGAAITLTVEDLFAKTLSDGITVADPPSGTGEVLVDPEDTEDCPDYRVSYPFDVEVILAAGTVVTPIRGQFIVLPDVTI